MAEVNDGFKFMITCIGLTGHYSGLVVFKKCVDIPIKLGTVNPSTLILPCSQRPAANELGTAFLTSILVNDSTVAGTRIFLPEADGVVDEVITGLEKHQDILGTILVHIANPVSCTL
jgi:hypothetical protein